VKPEKVSKKTVVADLFFGDGTKLTAKQKRQMDEDVAKHRTQRIRKRAA